MNNSYVEMILRAWVITQQQYGSRIGRAKISKRKSSKLPKVICPISPSSESSSSSSFALVSAGDEDDDASLSAS